jgi:hypothetical protein
LTIFSTFLRAVWWNFFGIFGTLWALGLAGISEISLARHIGIGVATRCWQRFDGKKHAKFKKVQKNVYYVVTHR